MQAETAVTTDPDVRAEPIDAESLYRAHATSVASFLRHMGTSESDLDDHLQDVFVVAHRKGGYQPGPASPRAWLASPGACDGLLGDSTRTRCAWRGHPERC